MARELSVLDLEKWIRRTHIPDGAVAHCAKFQKAVALPGGGRVDLVSIVHREGASPAPDHFSVGLWDLSDGVPDEDVVGKMCAKLAIFRAWYAQILEKAEILGRRRRHQVSLHGNLVLRKVPPPGALVDLLSHFGGDLAFWISPGGLDRTELYPYYGKNAPSTGNRLSVSLDHLGWESHPEEASIIG